MDVLCTVNNNTPEDDINENPTKFLIQKQLAPSKLTQKVTSCQLAALQGG